MPYCIICNINKSLSLTSFASTKEPPLKQTESGPRLFTKTVASIAPGHHKLPEFRSIWEPLESTTFLYISIIATCWWWPLSTSIIYHSRCDKSAQHSFSPSFERIESSSTHMSWDPSRLSQCSRKRSKSKPFWQGRGNALLRTWMNPPKKSKAMWWIMQFDLFGQYTWHYVEFLSYPSHFLHIICQRSRQITTKSINHQQWTMNNEQWTMDNEQQQQQQPLITTINYKHPQPASSKIINTCWTRTFIEWFPQHCHSHSKQVTNI